MFGGFNRNVYFCNIKFGELVAFGFPLCGVERAGNNIVEFHLLILNSKFNFLK